jgi:hypothetical protein
MSRRCALAAPDREEKGPIANFDSALSAAKSAFSAFPGQAGSVWHTACLTEKTTADRKELPDAARAIAGMRIKI